MKPTKFILTAFIGISAVIFLSSGGLDLYNANGTSTSTGAPGEPHTCSQAGCHGAGNGNGTSGGLADNAGPGYITVTSIPAMTFSMYVPGTTYSIIVTVHETGKASFGFDAEMLDNSALATPTACMINNTLGTLTITDVARTHLVHGFGTGRSTVTHSLGGGIAANTSTFGFNWKAPASGTVNIWASGTACNNDNLENAMDNVYLFHQMIVPYVPGTGIKELTAENSFQLFPNPTKDQFTLSFINTENAPVKVELLSPDGRIVRSFADETGKNETFNKVYDVSEINAGIYYVKIISGKNSMTKKIILN